MDSDNDEYFGMDSDDEMNSDEEMEISMCAPKVPSFETMTADDIVILMNQHIEEVESIVEVSMSVIFFFVCLQATASESQYTHTKRDAVVQNVIAN